MADSEIDKVAQSKDAPKEVRSEEAAKAAFDTKLAELRARDGGGDSTDFSDALEADGVKAKVTPKEGAKKAPVGTGDGEDAADSDESKAIDETGMDALLDAVAPDSKGETREAHIDKREALQKRAEDAKLPPEIARALAGHVKPEIAEKWLDSLAARVESKTAGQLDSDGDAAPAGAASTPSAAEVKHLLGEELGEETATAFAGLIAGLEARLVKAETVAEQSFDATRSTVRAQAKTVLTEALGEVSGQFSDLVRDGVIDPKVGRTTAALIQSGDFSQGDLKGALEAACRAHGLEPSGDASARQQSRQTQPDLDAPSPGRESLPGRLLTQTEVQTRLSQVAEKHREDPNRGAVLKKAAAKMAAHNERQRQKR